MQDHLYTWKFDKDSRLIRFYLWAWEGEASDLNFCKLFWGMLFSPLAILFHVLRFVFTPIFDTLHNALQRLIPPSQEETDAQRRRRWDMEDRERKLKIRIKAEKGPSGLSRALDRITGSIDSAVSFFQDHTTVSKVFVVLGIAVSYLVGAAACLAALIGIGYVIVTWTATFLMWLGIFVGAVIIVGLCVLLAMYLDESGKGKSFGERIVGAAHELKLYASLFVRFVQTGYHATKYRTCPRIEVTGLEDRTSPVLKKA